MNISTISCNKDLCLPILCLVTTPKCHDSLDTYLEFVQQSLDGGVNMVQFRDKNRSFSEQLTIATELHKLTKSYNTPLIINDNVQLAQVIDAEGIHLGQEDMPPTQARSVLGPSKLIGLSIENMEQLHQANLLSTINYVGASAIFPTISKNNCKTYWGLNGLQQICQQSRHPVIAIGGIDINNIHAVMQQGANGVAVIGALHNITGSPEQQAKKLYHSMQIEKNHAK